MLSAKCFITPTGVSSKFTAAMQASIMEVSIMNNKYTLPVPAPHHFSFAVRDIPDVTVEQRDSVLKALHYNEFAFPAGMLTVDMLSDSGTTRHDQPPMGSSLYGR